MEQIEENENKIDKINIAWNFIIKQGINFVDLYDALNSFDKVKLYNKILEQTKEKGKKSGIDNNIYPRPLTLLLGLNLSF